ncbi:hypothetical protein M3J09_013322 [Ascochyta lentis]
MPEGFISAHQARGWFRNFLLPQTLQTNAFTAP